MDVTLVQKHIDSVLAEKKVNYFYGGSQRFGFANEKSDLDVFLFVSSLDTDQDWLINEFGLEVVENPYPLNRSVGFKTKVFNVKVDFIFIPGEGDFNDLKKEHLAVEAFLISNLTVGRLIKTLKKMDSEHTIKGALIYKALLRLAEDR